MESQEITSIADATNVIDKVRHKLLFDSDLTDNLNDYDSNLFLQSMAYLELARLNMQMIYVKNPWSK